MSDIPVGSPPVPPGRHAAPGGWYPDPLDQRKERYWDGWQWSRNTRDITSAAGSQPGQSPYGPPQGYPPQPPQAYPPQGYGSQSYPPRNQSPQAGPPPAGPGDYPQAPPQQPYPYPPQQYQPNYPAVVGGRAAATADGVPLASWWWRVLAVVVDSVLVSLIAAIPSFPIYGRLFDQIAVLIREAMQAAQSGQSAPVVPSTGALISTGDQLLLTLITVGVSFVYQLVFLRLRSATPGKLLCRLRVVPVDAGRHPGPLAWSTVVIRVAVWVLPGLYVLFTLFKLLDALFPLWQPKRQAIHDLVARTQVVRLG